MTQENRNNKKKKLKFPSKEHSSEGIRSPSPRTSCSPRTNPQFSAKNSARLSKHFSKMGNRLLTHHFLLIQILKLYFSETTLFQRNYEIEILSSNFRILAFYICLVRLPYILAYISLDSGHFVGNLWDVCEKRKSFCGIGNFVCPG
jgi:hypothetical protein